MKLSIIRKRLSRKEVPLLVTLFAAIVGWAINHVTDRALASPTVEYKTEINTEGKSRIIKVTLTNLSRQAFFGLKFEIQAPEIQPCETLPEYKPPAWASRKAPESGTDGIAFLVEQLHPDWEITMCAKLMNNAPHKFILRETGIRQGDASKQAVRLVTPSLETFFVKCNIFLMLLLGAVSLIAFFYWLIWSEDGV